MAGGGTLLTVKQLYPRHNE
uniref:Uncharacterized protein n=1 Tax=Anguilla anguilla TaxID=7936 RepID=A0A0E9UPQ7_ANGAN